MNSNAIGTREHMTVIESNSYGKTQIDVLQYDKLLGSTNVNAVMDMYFMEKQNIKARQVAIYLNGDSVKVEPGAMSYYKGQIEMISGVTAGNALGRVFSSMTTGESIAQPEYKGTGTVVLEPSFNHFLTIQLDNDEIVVDKGMFYAAQSSVEVKPIMQKNISSTLLGGEGIFQIALRGSGLVVLESRVPASEIDIIELNNESLKVDGNFAILRTGNLDFTVERSAKTLLGSAVSGEGLVNVYKGTGSVWLAPTIKIYKTFDAARYMGGGTAGMNMNSSRS